MPRTANRVVSNLSSKVGEGYVDWEDGAGLVLCSTLDLLSSFSEKKRTRLKRATERIVDIPFLLDKGGGERSPRFSSLRYILMYLH